MKNMVDLSMVFWYVYQAGYKYCLAIYFQVNSANLAVDSVDSVDFYLPNRGHTDSKGEWRAVTWRLGVLNQMECGTVW